MLCFLFSCFGFSGLYNKIPVSQLLHRTLLLAPPQPPPPNTVVKESLGHVTVSALPADFVGSSLGASSLATHVSRKP